MTFIEPNESSSKAAKSVLLTTSNQSDGAARKPFPSLFDEASVALTLAVPAYNEEVRLPIMMDETMVYLESRARKDRSFTYEVIIVDDGSRDNTAKVGLAYSEKFTTSKVRVLVLHENHGKGGAVRKGMMRARGKRILMVDADGTENIRLGTLGGGGYQIRRCPKRAFIRCRWESPPYDVGRRSRTHGTSQFADARVSFLRVSVMCASGINDTQCGFKLFSRYAAQKIFPSQHIERWAFDVELLYLANKQSIPIMEVAVNWQEIDGSKVNLFSSIPQMARDIFSIRLCYLLGIWQISKGQNCEEQVPVNHFRTSP